MSVQDKEMKQIEVPPLLRDSDLQCRTLHSRYYDSFDKFQIVYISRISKYMRTNLNGKRCSIESRAMADFAFCHGKAYHKYENEV
jgi:hypothetical protein